ncbi:endoribonuclease L-PSP [Pseudarcicella hirudinis]|uniref:Endoribonuclease L-PSP n=1 Tax=Pseudarcicella hirudinis TaxID=1079859 RepID=A0A1I5UYB4_9BACT|nr:Rid family detoxifying hydrolase [Pseudarcicella hirudinis]SFQ00233.1 endoribonuclease L-PSP [Pseudarcicella hirudinis]
MKKAISFLFCLISFQAFCQHKEVINTDKAPQPIGPYSQAIKSNGFLYVSGQVGVDPVSRKLVEGGVEAEVVQIMANIKAILSAAKLDLNHVVNTNIYMKDLSYFQKVNEIYGKYFSGSFPARTTIGVANLPIGANIEITVVASY